MKRMVIFVVVVLSMLLMNITFASAAVLNDRSTRAFSMEGAFVAQADDSSAVWYNPAGLVPTNMSEFDFTLQYLTPKSDNKNVSDYKMYALNFAGARKDSSVGFGENLIYYDFTDPDPKVKQTWGELTLGGGTNFGTKIFSLGLSAGLVMNDITISGASNQDQSYLGFTGALGTLIKAYQGDHVSINIGAVYRPHTTAKNSNTSSTTSSTPDVELMPESKEYGVNATFSTALALIKVNYQIDNITHTTDSGNNKSVTNSVDNQAIGSEIIIPIVNDFNFIFRIGQRKTKGSQNSTVTYFDQDSQTLGVGVTLGQHMAIDLAQRTTDYKTQGFNNTEVKLTSVSASWMF